MKVQDNSAGWPEGWLAAAAAGVFAAVMVRVVGDLGLVATLVIGLFVFLVFGVLLGMFWGGPVVTHSGGHGHGDGHGHGAHSAAGAKPVAAGAHQDAGHAHGVTDDPAKAVAASEPVAEAVLAAPVSFVSLDPTPEAPMTLAASPEPVAEAAAPQPAALFASSEPVADAAAPQPVAVVAVPAPVAEAEGAEAASLSALEPTVEAPMAEPTRIAAPEPVAEAPAPQPAALFTAAEPVAEAPAPVMAAEGGVDAAGSKPVGLSGPRGGVADKLQTIEGIGPVLEKLCHELGIYHFDQIAGWGVAETAWMDSNLKGFKGRVTRDKWVRQAKVIGEVGIEAFLIRAKTNDY